jgi:hypothetical protein
VPPAAPPPDDERRQQVADRRACGVGDHVAHGRVAVRQRRALDRFDRRGHDGGQRDDERARAQQDQRSEQADGHEQQHVGGGLEELEGDESRQPLIVRFREPPREGLLPVVRGRARRERDESDDDGVEAQGRGCRDPQSRHPVMVGAGRGPERPITRFSALRNISITVRPQARSARSGRRDVALTLAGCGSPSASTST